MRCRIATPADAPRLVEIYAPYVANTAVSFATTAPTEEDFLHKIASPYPFLVCEENGNIIGYAYAAAFREKEAYRWDVELTIYIDGAYHGRGTGKALLARLIALLRAQGYLNVYSCITLPNDKSIGLHEALGFVEIGRFDNSGYKLGKWHSVTWYHLPLGLFDGKPAEPTPLRDLPENTLSAILSENEGGPHARDQVP